MGFKGKFHRNAQQQKDMDELFNLIANGRKPVAKDAVTVSNEEYVTQKKYWADLQKKNIERASNKASNAGYDKSKQLIEKNAAAAMQFDGISRWHNFHEGTCDPVGDW